MILHDYTPEKIIGFIDACRLFFEMENGDINENKQLYFDVSDTGFSFQIKAFWLIYDQDIDDVIKHHYPLSLLRNDSIKVLHKEIESLLEEVHNSKI
jgi:hypothetical protein